MADVAPEIQSLRERYCPRLVDLHDDYVNKRMLWESLRVRVIRYNENPVVVNPITGQKMEGSDLARRAPASLQRLTERSFKDVVSQFELFLSELVRVWLIDKPQLISEKALNLGTLLGSRSLQEAQAAAISEAVESTIADKMYGRPEKWLKYVRTNLGLDFSAASQAEFLEMKARRDVLEHHNGIVDASYQDKAREARKFQVGEKIELIEQDVGAALR
jgi:hypothetical protein